MGIGTRTIEAKAGITGSVALRHALPLQAVFRTWFNPGFASNYFNFQVLGILSFPIQLAGLLVAVRAGASEYGERQAEPLLTVAASRVAILLGKLATYTANIDPVSLLAAWIPHLCFGAPAAAHGFTLAFVTLWFTVMLVMLATGSA